MSLAPDDPRLHGTSLISQAIRCRNEFRSDSHGVFKGTKILTSFFYVTATETFV